MLFAARPVITAPFCRWKNCSGAIECPIWGNVRGKISEHIIFCFAPNGAIPHSAMLPHVSKKGRFCPFFQTFSKDNSIIRLIAQRSTLELNAQVPALNLT